jgi:hypothetical protein
LVAGFNNGGRDDVGQKLGQHIPEVKLYQFDMGEGWRSRRDSNPR